MKESEFHQRCGYILRKAVAVESALDFFIANYLIKPQGRKTWMLHDFLLVDTYLEKKISLFQEICKDVDIDEKELKRIVESIRFVQQTRNKAAHYESVIQDSKIGTISFWSRKSRKKKGDSIDLTEGLMEKFKEASKVAVDIYKLHIKFNQK